VTPASEPLEAGNGDTDPTAHDTRTGGTADIEMILVEQGK